MALEHPSGRPTVDFFVGMLLADLTVRTVLDAMTEGAVIVDPGGIIVHANRAAAESLGYADGDLVRRPLSDLLPAGAHVAHAEHLSSFFDDPRRRPMGLGLDLSAVRADGTEVPVEVSISYLDVHGGRLGIALFTDVSDRREAERRLAESVEALSQFAGWVAHDLRGSVAEMSGIANALLDQVGDDVDELIGALAVSGNRLSDVVTGLLTFARSSTGAAIDLVEVDAGQVMDDVLPRVARRADLNSVEIRIEPGLPTVLAVREWLAEVLYNLVLNGILHGGADGVVNVSRGAAGEGEVAIEVRDQGSGLRDDLEAAIADGTAIASNGLGLHIVRSILERLGGHLEYVGSDEGAVFRVVLSSP